MASEINTKIAKYKRMDLSPKGHYAIPDWEHDLNFAETLLLPGTTLKKLNGQYQCKLIFPITNMVDEEVIGFGNTASEAICSWYIKLKNIK